ncbi:MAG: hypothetical protein HYV17_07880 [Xanthomonadales bacterium]|nr:hypothetical protein [Xanthomonadales bacterium]
MLAAAHQAELPSPTVGTVLLGTTFAIPSNLHVVLAPLCTGNIEVGEARSRWCVIVDVDDRAAHQGVMRGHIVKYDRNVPVTVLTQVGASRYRVGP